MSANDIAFYNAAAWSILVGMGFAAVAFAVISIACFRAARKKD